MRRLTVRERVYLAVAFMGLVVLAGVGTVGRWFGLLPARIA
ncbi:MAG TPA: hypothetical protein VH420_10555 [Gaiellaceae bacterium]|jgi:hypothetical protein